MMKAKYIKPMTDIHVITTEKFMRNSKTNDSASTVSAGSQNEKEQPDIQTGGSDVAGSETNPLTEQNSINI